MKFDLRHDRISVAALLGVMGGFSVVVGCLGAKDSCELLSYSLFIGSSSILINAKLFLHPL